MVALFNAGALFILFREALEAAIVLGVVLNFVAKTVRRDEALARRLRRQIWLGVAAGVAASLALGAAFTVVYYVLRQDVFSTFEPIWEGSFKAVACILLTVMAFSMLHAGDLERKWERKMMRAGLERAARAEAERAAAAAVLDLEKAERGAEDAEDGDAKPAPEPAGAAPAPAPAAGADRAQPPESSAATLPPADASHAAAEPPAPHAPLLPHLADSAATEPARRDARRPSRVSHPPSADADAADPKAAAARERGEARAADRPYALFVLVFTVVLREGVESVIFLTGVGQGEPYSLIIPGFLGVLLGLLLGVLLHRGLGRLHLRRFLLVSAACLLVVAAGLAANVAHEFEEYAYVSRARAATQARNGTVPAVVTPAALAAALAAQGAGGGYPNGTTRVSQGAAVANGRQFRRAGEGLWRRQADGVADVDWTPTASEVRADPNCPEVNGTARGTCRVWTYRVAAEDLEWDYAPSGYNHLTGVPFVLDPDGSGVYTLRSASRVGSRYMKMVYEEYEDAAFLRRKRKAAWQGFLGPVIRAEVGDVVRIDFLNRASRPCSVHPHGALYTPPSEGAATEWNWAGAPVNPGARYEFVWSVGESAGPAQGDGSSVLWAYHSHMTEGRDVYAGLAGPFVVYRAGMLDAARGRARDADREYVAVFSVVDENASVLAEDNVARYAPGLGSAAAALASADGDAFRESNLMHAVNGRVFNNLDGLVAVRGERVRWHLMAFGNEVDIHTAHWHGNTVVDGGRRRDVVELLPATFRTVDMVAANRGTWLLHCHVADHIAAGMVASYQVKNSAEEAENVWTEPLAPQEAYEVYPDSTTVLWDASGCCDETANAFFQIMNALVGWRAIATVATVSAYFGYWALALALWVGIKAYKRRRRVKEADNEEEECGEAEAADGA